jgi:hypothetical protein
MDKVEVDTAVTWLTKHYLVAAASVPRLTQ